MELYLALCPVSHTALLAANLFVKEVVDMFVERLSQLGN